MVDAGMSNSLVFLYDADCRFCTSLARWLSKVDVFQRVIWTPYQSLDAPPSGLTWDDLKRSAYLVDGGAQQIEGFYAFRMLTVRILLLAPLAPIVWFPGINVLGTALYRWVARNRYRLFGCS